MYVHYNYFVIAFMNNIYKARGDEKILRVCLIQKDIADLGPRHFSAGGKPAQRTGNKKGGANGEERRGSGGYRKESEGEEREG